MSAQQESGQLVTGLKRWKMRQSCRSTSELSDGEKWICPRGCGKMYRVSSTVSIQKHTVRCSGRPGVESPRDKDDGSDASSESSLALTVVGEEKRGGNVSESKLDRPLSIMRIPAQFDGFEEDTHLGPDIDNSDNALLHQSSSSQGHTFHSLAFPDHQFIQGWEGTSLRELLRRQQLETEHLSARHSMEIVALRDGSGIVPLGSRPPFILHPSHSPQY